MTTIGNATISHPRDFAQSEYVWPSSSGSVYMIIFIKTVIWKKIIDLIEYYQCFSGNGSKQHQLQYWFFWFSLSMRMESITLFTNKLTPITRRETNFQHISQYFVGLFPSMANMLSENLLYPRREEKGYQPAPRSILHISRNKHPHNSSYHVIYLNCGEEK